jgi:hypothetical protein
VLGRVQQKEQEGRRANYNRALDEARVLRRQPLKPQLRAGDMIRTRNEDGEDVTFQMPSIPTPDEGPWGHPFEMRHLFPRDVCDELFPFFIMKYDRSFKPEEVDCVPSHLAQPIPLFQDDDERALYLAPAPVPSRANDDDDECIVIDDDDDETARSPPSPPPPPPPPPQRPSTIEEDEEYVFGYKL